MSEKPFDENFHKALLAKANSNYDISRELESEAERLMSIAKFLAERGDKLSEAAMAYANRGELP